MEESMYLEITMPRSIQEHIKYAIRRANSVANSGHGSPKFDESDGDAQEISFAVTEFGEYTTRDNIEQCLVRFGGNAHYGWK